MYADDIEQGRIYDRGCLGCSPGRGPVTRGIGQSRACEALPPCCDSVPTPAPVSTINQSPPASCQAASRGGQEEACIAAGLYDARSTYRRHHLRHRAAASTTKDAARVVRQGVIVVVPRRPRAASAIASSMMSAAAACWAVMAARLAWESAVACTSRGSLLRPPARPGGGDSGKLRSAPAAPRPWRHTKAASKVRAALSGAS
jgi:hypothetical protein